MAKCEVCGNDYYLSFEVAMAGNVHVFDSFECAIHKLAPTCTHCGCRIIGHGIEAEQKYFCCASCARSAGIQGITDHLPENADAPKLSAEPGSKGGHFN